MAISNIWGMAKLEVGKKVGRVGTPLEAKLGIYTTSKALGMVVEGGRESINNTLINTSFRSFYFQMRVHLKACKLSLVNWSCMDEFSYKHILITDTSFVITPLLNPNFQFPFWRNLENFPKVLWLNINTMSCLYPSKY